MTVSRRSTRFFRCHLILAGVVVTGLSAAPAARAAGENVSRLLKQSGITGGFIVHVGCGDGKATAELYGGSAFRVHGLDTERDNIVKARQLLVKKGINGPVCVAYWSGERLPYVDNVVNLLIVERRGKLSDAEIVRVLAPQGTACFRTGDGWKTITKPRPKNIDEWTHYLHDADGNAVAHDEVVGPPRHFQWLGSPRWSRHHDRMASMSALVSAGGRLFYVMDEGSRISIQLPSKWMLIARDAFNGTVLWKRPIPNWQSRLWPLKSGPTQLARRLVATKDRVYVTLGYKAPLSILDARTGKTLHTVENSKATEEVILADGTLFLLVNKGKLELEDYKPKFNVGDQARVRTEFLWNEQPRILTAADPQTGKVRWTKKTKVAPLTMASARKRLYFHNGEKVVCLNATTGAPLWTGSRPRRKDVQFNFGPRLLIYKDVVLFAGGDRKMAAFDADSGKELWSAPHDKSGYESPEDLLVSGGLVWSAPTTRTGDTGAFTGRDPRTGEVKSKFAPDVNTYWFHHRCYIAKATDKFILPSRTGIEFVDFHKKTWQIHHWVRGGCLYGVMPCNGLLYAPPNNCACYPEAKLFGFNALAPAAKTREVPRDVPDAGRLERGPAYGKVAGEAKLKPTDWPTYRGNFGRTGNTKTEVNTALGSAWDARLGGRLTSPVIAGGKLYVAQVDAHTLHAIDSNTGKPAWKFTAGGRIDSPPTLDGTRVLFGCCDGWVYCLRADDGALAWRFRAAPLDRRTMVFEQLESVWPVHGSVLVQDGAVYAVAGRSNFLDGGLRFLKLDAKTGRKLAEQIIDDRDPDTGKNLQVRLQTLQMPVGLPDILSTDGKTIYMRSQKFDKNGKRLQIGPVSGNAAAQGAAQSGEGRHLFAPMGFLDGDWFHRAYWVYGRSFAGGHNGYYQAGKFTQAGRILVADGESVYGFARKPQYYRWTTPLEHQLFGSGKAAPPVDPKLLRRGRRASMVRFEKSASLNPKGKEIVVEAWVKAQRPNGTVLAHGGPADGYALILKDGRPRFVVRRNGELVSATAKNRIIGKWTHLIGTLGKDEQVRLFVNGKLAKTSKAAGLLQKDPVQSLEIGADDGSAVGQYRSPFALRGTIDEVKVFHGSLSAAEVAARFKDPQAAPPKTAELVLSISFEKGKAKDTSGKKNDGRIEGAFAAAGKVGGALQFRGGRGGNRGAGSVVKHRWNQDLPVLARAMVLSKNALFVAGPPDVMDEEETFKKLEQGDKEVGKLLKLQDKAIQGSQGALLIAVSPKDGKRLAEFSLPSPPTWDGMAAADGKLFITTIDGRILCVKGQ